jgi:hypothetical protein
MDMETNTLASQRLQNIAVLFTRSGEMMYHL